MGNFLELLLNGPVDFGHLVAVNVTPKGRNSVQVLFTLGIVKVGSVTFCNNRNIFIHLPLLLLGERVPKILFIFSRKIFIIHFSSLAALITVITLRRLFFFSRSNSVN